ncbi:MAG TPA: ion channel [Verrucomicrobiae bacterium]|nr:ion channel [Verrucomicrobiae bacterium]
MPEQGPGKGKPPAESWRVLGRDGRFNITADKSVPGPWMDLYHRLLSISWPRFFGIVSAVYFLINILFAEAYYACGPEALEGIRRGSVGTHFLDCFFFSVQTIATIGYGRISPLGIWPNILVTIEALTGLMLLGLLTGLLFSRFSRPTARVLFSRNALITLEGGTPRFFFRLANQRLNQIVEAHISAALVKTETNAEGEKYRRIYDLALERSVTPLFIMTWTVVHPIDKTSPLHGMTAASLAETETEILISVTGMDNVFSQTIHARISYTVDDILWEHRFEDMLTRRDGKIHVALQKIHDVAPVRGAVSESVQPLK